MMTLKTILSFTEVSEYSSGEWWVLARLGEVVQDRKTSWTQGNMGHRVGICLNWCLAKKRSGIRS